MPRPLRWPRAAPGSLEGRGCGRQAAPPLLGQILLGEGPAQTKLLVSPVLRGVLSASGQGVGELAQLLASGLEFAEPSGDPVLRDLDHTDQIGELPGVELRHAGCARRSGAPDPGDVPRGCALFSSPHQGDDDRLGRRVCALRISQERRHLKRGAPSLPCAPQAALAQLRPRLILSAL